MCQQQRSVMAWSISFFMSACRVAGRVVLPAEACKELGVDIGDTVIIDVGKGKVQLHTHVRHDAV